MRKILGRFFVFVLASICLVSFFYDVMRWLGGANDFLRLGDFWYYVDARSLNLVQAIIQRYLWSPLWDTFIVSVLLLPVWLFLGVILIPVLYFTCRREILK